MIRFDLLLAVRCAVLATIACSSASAQSTWYVDASGTPPGTGTAADPYTAIQNAIQQHTTVDGDTLSVAPGVYTENLIVSKRVRIVGSGGPDVTTLRAATHGNLVTGASADITPTALLAGFTLDGSADPSGVGIYLQNATLAMDRCVIRGFSTGVGVDHLNQYLDASRSTIARNQIGIRNRLAIDPGIVTLLACIVRGNGTDIIDPNSGAATNPQYSCVPSAFQGGGGLQNTSADPKFWSLAVGDLHLLAGSPCINSGGPFVPLDPDGTLAEMGGLTYAASYVPAPIVYCTAKVNSQGCTPLIFAQGAASASGTSLFVVSATSMVPQKPGLLLLGWGKNPIPFQGSWLCLQGPIKRVGSQVSSGATACSGVYKFDLGAYVHANPQPMFTMGAFATCQWWGRDPADPNGGSQLSDALSFGVGP